MKKHAFHRSGGGRCGAAEWMRPRNGNREKWKTNGKTEREREREREKIQRERGCSAEGERKG